MANNWIVLVSKKTHKVVAVLGPEYKAVAYNAQNDFESENEPVSLHDMWFHKQPKLGDELAFCVYCSGKVGKNALEIEGDLAHKNCHREACK